MTTAEFFVWIGAFLVAAGTVRLILVRDLHLRLVALNVAASGGLLVLVALAARATPPDPVLHALALTGIVITVCFTGVALVLVRHVHVPTQDDAQQDGATGGGRPEPGTPGTAASAGTEGSAHAADEGGHA